MTFEEKRIPIGSKISFTLEEVRVTINSARDVSFGGEICNITLATRNTLSESYTPGIVPEYYWIYNGRRLKKITAIPFSAQIK